MSNVERERNEFSYININDFLSTRDETGIGENELLEILSDFVCPKNEKSQSYTMSAYLIAQLGKNYATGVNNRITGDELLSLALQVIAEIRYSVGGMVIFLEAEPIEKLLQFYQKEVNGFKTFNTRISKGTSEEHELVQLLKIL